MRYKIASTIKTKMMCSILVIAEINLSETEGQGIHLSGANKSL